MKTKIIVINTYSNQNFCQTKLQSMILLNGFIQKRQLTMVACSRLFKLLVKKIKNLNFYSFTVC